MPPLFLPSPAQICYATTLDTRVIGDASYATIDKIVAAAGTASVSYHGLLAVLSSTLVLAAGAGKLSWLTMLAFSIMWIIGVYAPLTHWQSVAGWMSAGKAAGGITGYGVLDHAGAHHVLMSAGAASLALTTLLGGLKTAPAASAPSTPASALCAFLGLAAYIVYGDPNSLSGGSGPSLVNLLMATSTAILTASVFDVVLSTKGLGQGAPTQESAVRSLITGAVSVSAGASLISPMWAAFFGFFAVLGLYTLDFLVASVGLVGLGKGSVFSTYFLGAAISSALTGLFANASYGGVGAGSFYNNSIQLGRQCAGISVVLLVSVVGTTVIYGFLLAVSKALGNKTSTLDAEAAAEKPLTSAEPAATSVV